MKWVTVAIMTAKIKSFNRFQLIKNADNDGIVIIIAIIVPLTKISFEEFLVSLNYFSEIVGNKNQKYFIVWYCFYAFYSDFLVTANNPIDAKEIDRSEIPISVDFFNYIFLHVSLMLLVKRPV